MRVEVFLATPDDPAGPLLLSIVERYHGFLQPVPSEIGWTPRSRQLWLAAIPQTEHAGYSNAPPPTSGCIQVHQSDPSDKCDKSNQSNQSDRSERLPRFGYTPAFEPAHGLPIVSLWDRVVLIPGQGSTERIGPALWRVAFTNTGAVRGAFHQAFEATLVEIDHAAATIRARLGDIDPRNLASLLETTPAVLELIESQRAPKGSAPA